MIVLFIILTSCSTFLGGLLALKVNDKEGLIAGFSAGTVVGVFFFDLLPEALSLGISYYRSETILSCVALGFVIYFMFDRLALLHIHKKEAALGLKASLAAGGFSIHSFFDGMAIGLAFDISHTTGVLVAVAVIIHAFSDGLNTVSVVLKKSQLPARSVKWLLVDSVAPVLGLLATCFFRPATAIFSLLIALVAGFFLYLGASDLLPESKRDHASWLTTAMTILGITILYLVNRLFVE